MEMFNEYALLIAVAAPVVALVAIQVSLYAAGERNTLLMPGLAAYPSIAMASRHNPVAPAAPVLVEAKAPVTAAANDALERQAA